MGLLRTRTRTADVVTWCASLRGSVPGLSVFNTEFLLRLLERPVEALERGGNPMLVSVLSDRDNFPMRAFTRDGIAAIADAATRTHTAGISAADLRDARHQ